MPSDRSRPPDSPQDAYTGVVMQQGRVILDRDFNTLRETIDDRDRKITLDVVGPCGTPDDGFRILQSGSGGLVQSPPLSPPSSPPLSPPSSAPYTGYFDLGISPGTMYVGGLRVEWPATIAGLPAAYSYFDQPDWLTPDPAPAPQTEIVWLQLDAVEVSATEDPDLLDVALGGPDTTQRLRLLRRVHRAASSGTACVNSWQGQIAQWQAQGLAFDPLRMSLVPQAGLQIGFTASLGSSDPCDPVATGGFLGAENQLIRVKWVSGGAAGAGMLLWGYDDASFIYRATADSTGTRLSLARTPPDAYHFPAAGQYVEVLRTTALLGTGGEAQSQTNTGVTPRCIAEDTGFVTTLAAAYDPTRSDNALTLSQALPYPAPAEPLFVRIWQGSGSLPASGGTMELIDPVANSSTGLVATISLPPGGTIASGAYWQMALRPATPQQIMPADLLTAPQPAAGPRRWACPLAVVDWLSDDVPQIQDCRVQFDDLVTLTARPGACCTVTVAPGDITASRSLQSIVNGFTSPGTLCLGAGVYTLGAPLRLGAAQSGLTIEAESGAVLSAAPGTEAGFSDGLIVIVEAASVTLRGLTLVPPATPIPAGLLNGLSTLSRIALPQAVEPMAAFLHIITAIDTNVSTMIGVRAAGCPSLTLDDCVLQFTSRLAGNAAGLFGFGLLASGSCTGLVVRDCQFDASGMPPTQTTGLLQSTGLIGVSNFGLYVAPLSQTIQGVIGCLVTPSSPLFLQPQFTTIGIREPIIVREPTGARQAADERRTTVFEIPIESTLADITGASFTGNLFTGVLAAISAHGVMDRIRVVDNTVTDSVAGFWLRPSIASILNFSASAEDLAVDGNPLWLKLMQMQYESFVAWLLGLLLPLPAGAVITSLSYPIGEDYTGYIAGNTVGALAGVTAAGTAAALPALAVVADPFYEGLPSGLAWVVAGNRVEARTQSAYPGTLLAISGRASVTGNLFSNQPAGSPPYNAMGLEVFPLEGLGPASTAITTTTKIAVTGNVIEGGSNLGSLVRVDAANYPAPLNTWLPFNASA
jgi:hypothetical protein